MRLNNSNDSSSVALFFVFAFLLFAGASCDHASAQISIPGVPGYDSSWIINNPMARDIALPQNQAPVKPCVKPDGTACSVPVVVAKREEKSKEERLKDNMRDFLVIVLIFIAFIGLCNYRRN